MRTLNESLLSTAWAAATKLGTAPLTPDTLGSGIILSRFCACGDSTFVGMTLPANCWRAAGAMLQSAPLQGLKIGVFKPLRSPERSAAVGTRVRREAPLC